MSGLPYPPPSRSPFIHVRNAPVQRILATGRFGQVRLGARCAGRAVLTSRPRIDRPSAHATQPSAATVIEHGDHGDGARGAYSAQLGGEVVRSSRGCQHGLTAGCSTRVIPYPIGYERQSRAPETLGRIPPAFRAAHNEATVAPGATM